MSHVNIEMLASNGHFQLISKPLKVYTALIDREIVFTTNTWEHLTRTALTINKVSMLLPNFTQWDSE